MKGVLITFEGAEGSGKSTQARRTAQYVKERGLTVHLIREPGGVKIGESIRRILLNVENTNMVPECEALLYMAARAQLVHELIEPALRRGDIVICDRFLDSTLVYQGYGCGVDRAWIKAMAEKATRGIVPDLTLLFDIEAEEGLARTGRVKDRIERRDLAYHNRVRRGYLSLAQDEPERIHVIPVDADRDAIFARVKEKLDALLKRKRMGK